MKIAVIGASAGVGLHVTRLALERGHEVATLARRVVPVPDRTNLRKVQGSVAEEDKLKAVVEGAEAVIVALGVKSPLATKLFSSSAQMLLHVLKEWQRSPTLIVLTGFGAGDSWKYNSLPMRIFFTLLLRAVYTDKTEQERVIAGNYSRWEIVRPGRLTDGPLTGQYRVLTELTPGMKVSSISRADVAHFMVTQAEQPTYLTKYPALTY